MPPKGKRTPHRKSKTPVKRSRTPRKASASPGPSLDLHEIRKIVRTEIRRGEGKEEPRERQLATPARADNKIARQLRDTGTALSVKDLAKKLSPNSNSILSKLLFGNGSLSGDEGALLRRQRNAAVKFPFPEQMSSLPENVSGLLSLSILKRTGSIPMTIILMGEKHNKNDICVSPTKSIPANELFFWLLKNSGTNLLDVFLEMNFAPTTDKTKLSKRYYEAEYGLTTTNEPVSFMEKTERILSYNDCFKKLGLNTKACSQHTDHVRFHIADARGSEPIKLISDIWELCLSIGQPNPRIPLENQAKVWNEVQTKVKKLLSATPTFDAGTYIDEILKRIKAEQQVSKITDSAAKSVLEKFKTDTIKDDLKTKLKDVFENIKAATSIPTTNPSTDWDYTDVINPLFLFFMDYYLLARVFRGYATKSGKINGPTKNVIIYAGNEHIKNYIKVLTSTPTALFTSEFSAVTASAPVAHVACLTLSGFAEKLAWNNNSVS
jgi:hypothetical protein